MSSSSSDEEESASFNNCPSLYVIALISCCSCCFLSFEPLRRLDEFALLKKLSRVNVFGFGLPAEKEVPKLVATGELLFLEGELSVDFEVSRLSKNPIKFESFDLVVLESLETVEFDKLTEATGAELENDGNKNEGFEDDERVSPFVSGEFDFDKKALSNDI
ncbi:unnamed protein product [[Candida] boidinii]|nr:unnamed protein product [[Candida] boidinii]